MNRFFSVLMLVLTPFILHAQDTMQLRATITTPGGELPFNMIIKSMGSRQTLEVINGDEHIVADEFTMRGNTFFIRLPVFNTCLKGTVSRTGFDGTFQDFSRTGEYILPFKAELNKTYRFIENPLPPKAYISGRYTAVFNDGTATDTTVGIFTQTANHLKGTFLTTTGDYRFLEGDVSADSFYLSAFDGSHVFLFKGKINDNGTLSGGYWSGKHYQATFQAYKNPNAQLPDATTLTYLKSGYDKVTFSFPDEKGKMISLGDDAFDKRAVIIQISGSWCPNCMDETSYMREIEQKYKGKPLAIVDLSFERETDTLSFKKSVARMRSHFGITYPILNAGLPKTTGDALPMLNRVLGFPTTIILDKDHNVVEIYTGFNGPATGELFVQFQKDFEAMLDELVR